MQYAGIYTYIFHLKDQFPQPVIPRYTHSKQGSNISPVLSNTKLSCMIPNSFYTQLLDLSCSKKKKIRIKIK